eukprot:c9793_g1_i1.p1 GENE.c9793_g1_i1~~c9793_g1_i1.p1  ORF type:complete len:1099 (+),score=250.37 c9793_g1_i1:1-3297(+)
MGAEHSGGMQQKADRVVYVNERHRNRIYPKNRVSNTKYTPLTFLPANLAEQFSQHMNRYFLLIACLQLFHEITPVHPASTWVPLIMVLSLSAAKEGFDDLRRHRRDRKVNEAPVQVIFDEKFENITAEEISVGDLVRVDNNQPVPCDLYVITSSNEGGSCYIQTSNLDGESDYKSRCALEETHNKLYQQVQNDLHHNLFKFRGKVRCNPPNTEVYEFNARLEDFTSEPLSLSSKQLLQQSSIVRHTEWVWGVAVYTANETKLGMNKKKPKMKWTAAETFINKLSLGIFFFQCCVVLLFGSIGNYLKGTVQQHMPYLAMDHDNTADRWYRSLIVPARYILLCSMMIPISLKVTLDFARAFYSKLIDWDENMCITEDGVHRYATSNNTAISEDLGQIDVVLTDKTGTLTQNLMVFKKCQIGKELFGDCLATDEDDVFEDQELLTKVAQRDPEVIGFFRALALCHAVVPQKQGDGSYEYRSSSPDEEALVKAAAQFGVKFISRTKNTIRIDVFEDQETYEVVQTLEFSSTRKKMSVVLKPNEDESNSLNKHDYVLFSKGADDMILSKLGGDDATQVADRAKVGLERFASHGLRTLCVAWRPLSSGEFEDFSEAFQQANRELTEREDKVAKVYEQLEQGLTLLGVTAIEDKLQAGVPDTISDLRAAGLRFWMLTGDKYTTALQVATACNLRTNTQPLVSLDGKSTDAELKSLMESELERYAPVADHHKQMPALIATTLAIRQIINSADLRALFLRLTSIADCVVCCRVTPLQKALIAQLVKSSGVRTLAIGDGGNDVNMIQEAHVGVGIEGREGQQAARAADYSIAQFQFLKPLMLVHGHLSFHRTAFISQYSFYKSLIVCFIQLLYATVSSFSGASLFNSLSLMGINVFYTGLIAFAYILDRDLDPKMLKNWPEGYIPIRNNSLLNYRTFIEWFIRAIIQALIVFVFVTQTFSSDFVSAWNGRSLGDEELGLVAFSALVWIQVVTICLESTTITFFNAIALIGTQAAFYILNAGFSSVPRLSMYSLMFHLFGQPAYWLTVLLVVVTALIPVVLFKFFQLSEYPTEIQKQRGQPVPERLVNAKSHIELAMIRSKSRIVIESP